MTLSQYGKLKDITFELSTMCFDYKDIKTAWLGAIRSNAIQNEYLKECYESDIVQNVTVFCTDANKVKTFQIRAHKKFTRLEYFKIEIMRMDCFHSIQDMRNILKAQN